LFDSDTGSDNGLYFAEAQSGSSSGGVIGRISSVPPFTVTRYQIPGSRVPYDLAAGADGGLWFLENVNGTTKIGRLTLDLTNQGAPTVSPEYDVGDARALSLIGAPDGGLWFIETSPAGSVSITRMSISSPLVGEFARHPLAAGVVPIDLAWGADGALWFTTGEAGNIGRMTPNGKYSLFCIGPGHPRAIAAGPGNAMSFTEEEDRVGRISTSPIPSGAPCPAPPVPASGGGTGGVKNVVKDTTPAKISLSGPTTQRFTNRGTIVVSVEQDLPFRQRC
jgi:virginiamycin B lyase